MVREFTESEAQQIYEAEKHLRESGLDVDHEHAESNANLILQHFQQNSKLPVTVASIYAFVEKNKVQFIWRTPAQSEYDKTAAGNPAAAQQLSNWLATQGKVGQLVNSGDEAYANLTLLLTELRNRREDVSATTIRNAIDRISNRPGRKLRIVEASRRTEPISAAAKNDDGNPFLGRDLVKQSDGSYRTKTPAEQRRDREAAESAKSSQAETRPLDASEQTWKNLADELLRDGTHSQQARIRSVYDREQGNSWRKIYEACKQETDASVAFRNAKKIQEELKQRS
jgi:hypothetical protein